MHILRQATVAAAATILPVLLFCIGLSWSAFQVLGTPQPLKQSIKDSGMYSIFVSDTLSKPSVATTNLIPADDPAVKKIIEQAFPPPYLQSQTNGIIDSMYTWVMDGTPTIPLDINFTEPTTRLLDGLSTHANQRLASLPQCATQADAAAQVGKSLLSVTCVPPNIDRQTAVQTFRDQLTAKDGPLHTTHIKEGSLKGSDGKPIEQSLRYIPEAYHQARTFFIAAVLITIILGAIIVFAAATKRKGIKIISIVMLCAGITSTFAALTLTAVTGKLAESMLDNTAAGQQIAARTAQVVHLLASDVKAWWLGYGTMLLVASVATLITLLVLRKREEEHREIHEEVDFRTRLEQEQESEQKEEVKRAPPSNS